MDEPDLVVVGAGISGLSLAFRAASEGKRVLVLEKSGRAGGCIHSEKTDAGYWFELGAHTAYNSYGGFLEMAQASGLVPVARGEARAEFGFLHDGEYRWLTPPKVLLELSWLEAAANLPTGLFHSKKGSTMAEHFSALLGPKNYQRVLSPFLSAVPSQSADEFPAEGPGSLFKKRPRRKDVIRSFGFDGGLQAVCEAVAKTGNLALARNVSVRSVSRVDERFRVELEDGRAIESRLATVATPVEVSRKLLAGGFPEVAASLEAIATTSIDSLGVVVAKEKCWMPACAFVVPASDQFFSCVTRDPFPDEQFRAFAFHFRDGLSREERLQRACELLRVERTNLLHIAEKRVTLPAPKRDHASAVAAIDRALQGTKLGLAGNYFDGLAIEDCVQRGFAEWQRIRFA